MPVLRFTFSASRLTSDAMEFRLREYCHLRNYRVKTDKLDEGKTPSRVAVVVETETESQLREVQKTFAGWMNSDKATT